MKAEIFTNNNNDVALRHQQQLLLKMIIETKIPHQPRKSSTFPMKKILEKSLKNFNTTTEQQINNIFFIMIRIKTMITMTMVKFEEITITITKIKVQDQAATIKGRSEFLRNNPPQQPTSPPKLNENPSNASKIKTTNSHSNNT